MAKEDKVCEYCKHCRTHSPFYTYSLCWLKQKWFESNHTCEEFESNNNNDYETN